MRRSAMIIGVSCLILTACNKESPTTNAPPAPGPHVMPGAPIQPPSPKPPAETSWSLDVKALAPPDTPLAGKINGLEFKPDKVEFEGDRLVIRQGKDFFADREVKIWLSGDFPTFEGLKLQVSSNQQFGFDVPHIHMSAKKTADELPKTEMYMNKYAMKLEFGKIANGKLPGKIHLCVPDEANSYVAGTFSVDAASLGGTKIHGSITLAGEKQKSYKLSACFAGRDAKNMMHGGVAGFTIESGSAGSVSSFNSHLALSENGDITFRHVRAPAGIYLVFITLDDRPIDWRWIEIKDEKEVRVDLKVDARDLGELEVTATGGGNNDRNVRLLPLDPTGKLPKPGGSDSSLAFQVSNYASGARFELPAGKDKAMFKSLKPGHYRVCFGNATVDVEVKAKETAKATVAAKPNS